MTAACCGGRTPVKLLSTTTFVVPTIGSSFKVPSSTRFLWVKSWGAAGGGYAPYSRSGGGGGFAQALIPVTGGETLTYYVGQGGLDNGGGRGLPGGGQSNGGGCGGGYTGIFRSYTPLIIAGGGGGAGNNAGAAQGGAGGGSTGTAGTASSGTNGGGGAQNAGGNNASDSSLNGGYLVGGGSLSASAGGGGGYYGGGAGTDTGSGGGGSGFVTASGNRYPTLTAGSSANPANSADEDFVSGTGTGTPSANTRGGGGLLIIRAYSGDPVAAELITL